MDETAMDETAVSLDQTVMDEVKRLINNFDSDFDPQTVSLDELEAHSIELGRVRIDYKKNKKFYFRTKLTVQTMTPLPRTLNKLNLSVIYL